MDSLLQQQITANIAMFGIATTIAVTAVSPPARSPVDPVPIALAAQSEPLSPAALATLSPPGPIGQQVAFNVAFAADFLSTGAQLFGRELHIPLTLAADIGNGTPVSTSVVRALRDVAAVEVDAGKALLTFGAEYVVFQTQFVGGLIPHRSAGATNTTLVSRSVFGSAPVVPTLPMFGALTHHSATRGAVRQLLTTGSVNPLSRSNDFEAIRHRADRHSVQGASPTSGSSGFQNGVRHDRHGLKINGHSD